MLCSNCGKNFNDDFDFCPYCGTKSIDTKFCPKCGFEDQSDYKYCPRCGIELLSETEKKKRRKKEEEIEKLEREGNYKSAIALCNEAIKSYSDNTKYKTRLKELKLKELAQTEYRGALNLEQQRCYKAAFEYCKKATEFDPNNEKYKSKKEELKELINKQQAEEDYQIAEKLDSNDTEYGEKLKDLEEKLVKQEIEICYKEVLELEKEGKYNSAIEKMQKVLNFNSDNIEYKEKLQELKNKQKQKKAQQYFNETLNLEKEEKYTEAIEHITKAIRLDSNDTEYGEKLKDLEEKLVKQEIEICYKEVLELEKEGKYKLAIYYCDKLIRLEPKNIIYKSKKEQLKEGWKKQSLQRAKKEYEKALKLEKEGKYYSAIERMQKALKFDSDNTEYKNKLKKLHERNKTMRLKAQNKKKAEEIYDKVLILELEGKYKEAINSTLNAITLDPNNIKYPNKIQELKEKESKKEKEEKYYQKAVILEERGKYKEAIEFYSKTIELDMTNPKYYDKKGICLYNLKQYSEAIEYYNKAINLNEEIEYYYKHKGECLKKLDCFKEAIECYNKAIELNLKNYQNYYCELIEDYEHDPINRYGYYHEYVKNLKDYEHRYYKKHYEELIEYYKKIIELDPYNEDYKIKLIHLTLKINEYDEAIRLDRYKETINYYDKLIKLKPLATNHYYHKTELLERLNRYKEAIECLEKAIEVETDPVNELIFCKKIVELDPNNTKYINILKEAEYRGGGGKSYYDRDYSKVPRLGYRRKDIY